MTSSPWVNWKSKPEKTRARAGLSRRFKRIMEKSEGENNIVCSGWMAQGKHGWNNTIESRLLIKGGNLAKLVPAHRAPSAKPDMSTSDLHHSSPQARINRPLTLCKSLYLQLPWFGRVQVGEKKLFSDKHTWLKTNTEACWCTRTIRRLTRRSRTGTGTHPALPWPLCFAPKDCRRGRDFKSEWDLSRRTRSGREWAEKEGDPLNAPHPASGYALCSRAA